MGVGLLIGALLARMRRFRAHAWCQSAIVLLNLAVIVLVMIPSFRAHVSPKIPLKLGKPYYALATAHAALGTITEIAGLYILLAAGTSVVAGEIPHHQVQALDANGTQCSGGSCSCREWQPTPAGTSRMCFDNELERRLHKRYCFRPMTSRDRADDEQRAGSFSSTARAPRARKCCPTGSWLTSWGSPLEPRCRDYRARVRRSAVR